MINTKTVRNKFQNSPNVLVLGEIDKYNAKFLIKFAVATLAPYLNNPNFKDHIPNKIIESLENSTPFITTVEGKLKSIIDEYKNGIFIKNRESIDLSAYEKLIMDSDYQKYLSINAGNSYKKLFNYKKTFQKIIKKTRKNVIIKINFQDFLYFFKFNYSVYLCR